MSICESPWLHDIIVALVMTMTLGSTNREIMSEIKVPDKIISTIDYAFAH